MSIAQVILVCAIGLITVHATEKNKVSSPCVQPITHYAELGCRPVYTKRSGNCPLRYECPFTEKPREASKCYYKSKEYAMGERFLKTNLDQKCVADCSCREDEPGKASISCAHIECPEHLNYNHYKNCVKQYKEGDCCSYQQVCDKEEIEKLKTCEYEGKTYKEGEEISSSEACMTCICGSDQTVKCTKINCGIEIFYADNINKNCAPIYLETRPCCPIGWWCGNEEFEIESTSTQKSTDMNMKCKFQDKFLDIGTKVMGDDVCVTCECNIPPLVTCTRALNC